MSETNWEKVKELFNEALLRQSDEREAFLVAASSGDSMLATEVKDLLGSFAQAKDFLEVPVGGEMPERTWHLENGRQISHYRIIEPIASGGMGEVYLADDTRLGRQVALKILLQEMLEDKSRLERFKREANAVSALNHPNILTIFDFEEEDGIHLFASEFVKGTTLRKRLESGRLPVAEALDISSQIASALAAAHGAGIIHRDIKPENIMIREDGYVKVLDFGLAKIKEKIKANESHRTLLQNQSLPGMIMGTVSYMSPEQARGLRVDERSDIFSLGILMYEMLAGAPPFSGGTTTDVLAAIIRCEPPAVNTLNPDVPIELNAIISHSLSKDPPDRIQSASELITSLRNVSRRLEFEAELKRSARPDRALDVEATVPRTGANGRPDRTLVSLTPDRPPLVGREKELEELTDLFLRRNARLVTLTGIGGTGKTRLAQELCGRLESEFRNGFAFVRLADVEDPSRVAGVIAQQLRVQEIVGRPIVESLKDHLQGKEMFLVIDNFEQVIGAAPLIADLLSNANGVVMLATSRERLHVQAEIEFEVLPLRTPDEEGTESLDELERIDSVKLFVERSKRVSPDFRLTEENATQIAMICSMLDGLPLAIELAAARSRIFSPATILEKLEARLAFLTGGARDLPERQQTMRAAVDWSYDLLNDDEKCLFRRLSVFACNFSAEAAEEVASDRMRSLAHEQPNVESAARQSVEFLDIFASLVDKSLLIRRSRGTDTVYRLLEIVREYAEDALERDDDANDIRLRHAMFFLSLAERAEPHLQTRDSAIWLRRLEEEYDNLRAVLRWSVEKAPQIAARLAAAIRHFWHIRGHLSEGLAWAQSILTEDVEMVSADRWKLLITCANITQFQGDIDSSYRFYEESLMAARQSGTQTYIANSLRGLGAIAYLRYDFERARSLLSEALMISRNAGDAFGMAAALARLGDISHVERDLPTARQLTSESLEIFQQVGYREGISAKLYNLGAIVYLEGDHELARKYFEESYVTSRELDEKINTRLIFDCFAALAAEDGNFGLAARLSGAAESLGATIGYTIEPAEEIVRKVYLDKLKAVMTQTEFEAEHEIGRRFSPEQAHELASNQVGRSTPPSRTGEVSATTPGAMLPRPLFVIIVLILFLIAAAIMLFSIWAR